MVISICGKVEVYLRVIRAWLIAGEEQLTMGLVQGRNLLQTAESEMPPVQPSTSIEKE
jgi:hypothetical protein